jgi:hypothetical protein
LNKTEKTEFLDLRKQLEHRLEINNTDNWEIKKEIFKKIDFASKMELSEEEQSVLSMINPVDTNILDDKKSKYKENFGMIREKIGNWLTTKDD